MGEPKSGRANPLVLVIDDEVTQRILVQETLCEAGYVTDEAENGHDGIAKATEQGPDLVILDVVMPDLDGFAVCQTLRRNPETMHTPILMLTGLEDEESIAQAFKAGATNFLTKPINWTLLAHHVRYILRASKVESELRTAKINAEAHSRAKTEILANMSHELRTPLNSIIGFADVTAKQALGPLDNEGYIDCANNIKEAGSHLLDLITDILELSKIEFGKTELREDIVDVPQVINACTRLVQVRLDEAKLKLRSDIRQPLPKIWADERKFKQMVLNLLSNAVKFTPAGGEIRVESFVADDGDLALRVRDNGIGIAAENIPRAMEPFSQVDSGLNRKYPGTGLGLPLTNSLVELHGGSLALESTLGEGTTVTLRFPATRFAKARKSAV